MINLLAKLALKMSFTSLANAIDKIKVDYHIMIEPQFYTNPKAKAWLAHIYLCLRSLLRGIIK